MAARILVIEDNPANLELMCYLLRAFGHTPLSAGDGVEGLAVAERERPDLILCDIQLPRADGYEVIRRLKANTELRAIPVVAVTAFAMVGDRDRLLGAGFDAYLAKPIVPETFVKQVEAYLPPDHPPSPSPPFLPPPPPEPEAADTTAGLTPTPETAPRATILVVDDMSVNLDLIRSTFEPLGYEVITARNPREGRALAYWRLPDLILSDIHMPGEGGFEFLNSVKSDPRLRAIPFVLISSMLITEERGKNASRGAEAFIQRPIDPLALVAAIETCLGRSRGQPGSTADDSHYSIRPLQTG